VHGKTLRAAALKGLEGEFHARANRLLAADDKAFTLSEHGRIWWDGAVVAQLVAGPSAFAPDVTLLADENLKPELRDGVQQRLESWMTKRIAERLAPLLALRAAADAKAGTPGSLPGFARAIAHQLAENFGSLDRAVIAMPENIGNLIRELKSFGVWVGKRTLYLPKLLRPEPASLLGLLWGVREKLEHIPAPPLPGLTSFENTTGAPYPFLEACGFRVVAGRPIRFDMLERLEDELEKGAASGAATDALLPRLVSLLGCGNDKLKEILSTLGWTTVEVADAGTVWRRVPVRPRKQDRDRAKKEPPPSRKTKPSATALNELAARFAKR
jgi:ATP-dependent RNA helicase SUPV3L1/SUV3